MLSMSGRFSFSQGDLVEVLLVEDNPGDVRLIREAFKESGVPGNLRVARDGEQAMQYLRREGPYKDSPRPTFVLLDLNLPKMDGREVLAAIREGKAAQLFSRVVPGASHDALKTILQQSTDARDAVSGVNLDEEAANMLRFQQAYQAAAKVISTSNTLFQSILSAING